MIIIIIIIIIIIPSNRPDTTFTNKKTKNTFLIDIAIPNTHNLAQNNNRKTKEITRTGERNT
jgi:hypothetical protein